MDGFSNDGCDSDEGFTCHPIVLSDCVNGLCLVVFLLWAVLGNLSW